MPCNRPANYTATFIELGGPDVRPIGPSLPVVLLAVFGIVGLTVLIPFVVVRILDRRRAASPSPAPPSTSSLRVCPQCASPAGPDWKYCMKCGAEIP